MPSNTPMQPDWNRRWRFLTQALIVSVALNTGLIATFIYSAFKKKEESLSFVKPPASATASETFFSNEEILLSFSSYSMGELTELLNDQETVESGYQKRDLALAALNSFHFFNLEKALGFQPKQKRYLSIQHPQKGTLHLTVFPGLTNENFEAALLYAKTEKWPLTTEGLFREIKAGRHQQDPSLLEAFYLSPEFHSMAALFMRSGLSLPKERLVDLLVEANFSTLQQIHQQQMGSQDLSPNRLKHVLLDYLNQRSLLAARILVEWDRDFILRRLEDHDLLTLIDLHTERTSAFEELLKALLVAPRSDAIQKRAAEKLYLLSGISSPEPPAPQIEVKKEALPSSKEKRFYTVQQGDNLWKIARKHKVTVEQLRKVNQLENDKLRPGKKLEIPS